MRNLYHVVVIGGGFSGVALTAQLVRRGDPALTVTLVDAGRRLGRGLAYSTDNDAHLLNTRAENMSLFADDPRHFVRWLRSFGVNVTPHDFVKRSVYGNYIESTFFETLAAEPPGGTKVASLVETRAVDILRESPGFRVLLADGRSLQCDSVVLATGHAPPSDPLSAWLPSGSKLYIKCPWHLPGLATIGSRDRILLLGTGLTMVDVALALSKNSRRIIHAISRRGLMPQAHAVRSQAVRSQGLPDKLQKELIQSLSRANLREITRHVRRCMDSAAQYGISWHSVIDALRPFTTETWRRLGSADRRRFLRWLRPYWDTNRHRMAPAVAESVAHLQLQGRLSVRAARLRNASDDGDSVLIDLRVRGETQNRTESYDWIINCTGPDFSRRFGRTLESQLLQRGMLTADPLGFGYVTDIHGTVFGTHGVLPGLFLLGPARRARDWEATAVPELREQSAKLAARLSALHGKIDLEPINNMLSIA